MNTYHLTYITPSSRMEIGTPRFWKQMQGWHYGDHNTITVNAVNRKEAKSAGMAKADVQVVFYMVLYNHNDKQNKGEIKCMKFG